MWKVMQVEGPVVCVGREEVLQALNEMKTEKAGFGMPALSIVVPIFKGKVISRTVVAIEL